MKKRLLSLLIVMFAVLIPTQLWAEDGVAEPYAVLSEDSLGLMTLTFYYNGEKSSWNAMDVRPFAAASERGWDENSSKILTVLFDTSFANYKPTSTAHWFHDCTSLAAIYGIENLKTDNVTDMNAMFMGCSALTNLDVSGFNTPALEVMSTMFAGCSKLTVLDLSSFDTQKVPYMYGTFNGCSSLKTIYVGSGWSTASVTTTGAYTFNACYNIVGGAGTTYDRNHVDYTYAHIDGGPDNPGYLTDIADKGKVVWSVIGTINGEWDTDTEMTSTDGVNYTVTIPYLAAGSYEFKIRANGSWDVNYGLNGEQNGQNIPVAVDEDNTGVVVSFNADTKEISFSLVPPVYTVAGDFTGWEDSQPMTKDNNGIYSITFDNLAVGGYAFKIKTNRSWDVNYGVDGARDGANISLVVSESGPVTIYFNPVTKIAGTEYPQATKRVATPTFSWSGDLLTISSETEGATINYTLVESEQYYLVGGNGEWSSDKSQRFTHTSDNVYTYILTGGTELWFAFGDATALDAINDGDWTQLYGTTGQSEDMSGSFDRRYNLGADKAFHMDGTAPFYRFTIDVLNKTYEITPIDINPGNIQDIVYPYLAPINVTSDVLITAWAEKQDMLTSAKVQLDYPHTAWQYLLVAADTARSVISLCEGNPKVDQQELSELTATESLAYNMYYERVAKRNEIIMVADTLLYLAERLRNTALAAESEPYAVLSSDSLTVTFYYDGQKAARGGIVINNSFINYDTNSPYGSATTAVIDASFADYRPTSTAYWFHRCSSLTSIMGMENLKTDNVTDMRYMFNGCESLTSFDVSGFNTANVTNMNSMFCSSSRLTALDLSGFNTENVTDMAMMFQDCYQLKELNISSFNTSNVTSFFQMFVGCSNLEYLDVSSFNTENVSNMRWMFGDCFKLTSIDLSRFNTGKVREMGEMFYNDYSLTSLDLSGFNTENLTNMWCMFKGCRGLKTLDISNFNTEKVKNMQELFQNCHSLLHINMSNFNTANVEEMYDMFDNCTSLASIQAGNAAIPDSIYAQISNPNLLVYVNNESLAPSNITNVVVNGFAKNIMLSDVTEGNGNFFCPEPFTAEAISYTRNFQQQTQVGVSRGWESIALPFDVQTILHEKQGVISPFSRNDNNKHFWLRRLSSNGLVAADKMEANVPYIISMPNSSEYPAEFNLSGRVTFSAANVTVPVTETRTLALADSTIMMASTMRRLDRSSSYYALNVGEVRGQYLEGSVFERDYREVRPFEAYTIHRSDTPAPRFVPINEMNGGATGIESLTPSLSEGEGAWYDLNGRKLQQKPKQKGVYINGKHKMFVK